MSPVIILLLILFGILLALAAFAFYAYRVCFYSEAHHQDDPYGIIEGEQYRAVSDRIHASSKRMEAVPYEPVSIKADDGLTLAGMLYRSKEGAPVEILFHGYRSCALRDCSGGHYLARKMGFNILVVDQRTHGGSEGTAITFGIRERYDCLAWIRFVIDEFGADTPIILSGLSMGAATVLEAAGLELPENVVCVLADSPFASPESIIRKVCRDRGMPDRLVYPFVRLGGKLFAGFDPNESCAMDALRRAKVPVLLLHGEDDRYVPCHMSMELKKACASRCELHTFPGAGHGLSYMIDPEVYEDTVYGFLRSIPALDGWIRGNAVQYSRKQE